MSAALAAVLAAGVATAIVLAIALAPVKAQAGAIAAAVCLLGIYLSGNPRLYCIWGLMLTIPLDLSKRFGAVIEKMGGETSFRVEMSDPFVVALLLFIAREVFLGLRPGIRIPKATYWW